MSRHAFESRPTARASLRFMRLVIVAVVAALVVPATAGPRPRRVSGASRPTATRGSATASRSAWTHCATACPRRVHGARRHLATLRTGRRRGRDVLRGRCLRCDAAQPCVDRSRQRDARAHHARDAGSARRSRRWPPSGAAVGVTMSAGSRCTSVAPRAATTASSAPARCAPSTTAATHSRSTRGRRTTTIWHAAPGRRGRRRRRCPCDATVVVSAPCLPIAATAADAPPIPAPKAPGSSPGTTPTTPKAKKPKVTLRKRALRSGKRLTVGSITCATRCRVRLSVGDGRRTVRRSLSVSRDGAAEDRQRLQAAQEGAPARRRHRRRHAAQDRPRPRLGRSSRADFVRRFGRLRIARDPHRFGPRRRTSPARCRPRRRPRG